MIVPRWIPLLLLCACGSQENPSAKGGPKAVEITVQAAEAAPRGDWLEVPGTLAAYESATVAAEAEGRVVAVRADLGDTVHAGAPLLELFDDDLEIAFEKAEVDRVEAERELTRIQGLFDAQMAMQADLDAAKARMETTKGASNLAKLRLDRATVRAPWTGRVAARYPSPGDYVRVGSAVVELTQVDPLRLQADVPESEGGRVVEGLPLEIHVAGHAAPVRAALSRVSPAVSERTRTFRVEAVIPNPDGTLKAGSFARVRLQVGERSSAVAVPARAVQSSSGVSRVYVLSADGATVSERPVTLLATEGDRAVVDGVAAGEPVAVRGAARLAEGTAVKVLADAPAADAPAADAPAADAPAADAAPAPTEGGKTP